MNVILIIFILLFFCKGDPVNQESALHIRLKKDPERINPLIFPNPTAREVYQYIHLPLADYNPESLVLEPILIQQIPSEVAIDTGKYKGGIAFDLEFSDQAAWDNGSNDGAINFQVKIGQNKALMTTGERVARLVKKTRDILNNIGVHMIS